MSRATWMCLLLGLIAVSAGLILASQPAAAANPSGTYDVWAGSRRLFQAGAPDLTPTALQAPGSGVAGGALGIEVSRPRPFSAAVD